MIHRSYCLACFNDKPSCICIKLEVQRTDRVGEENARLKSQLISQHLILIKVHGKRADAEVAVRKLTDQRDDLLKANRKLMETEGL